MSVIRILSTGNWSKPPLLTAARKVLMDALSHHVSRATLDSMASFTNGTSYDTGLLAAHGGMPIIRISNITDPTSEYLQTIQDFAEKYTVKAGDLLVSWSASFKSIIWPGPKGILNQHIFKVTERPGNHRGYIRHAIEAAFDEIQQRVVGIGMMHLRRNDFLGHEVSRPDIEIQKAVCEFLDWLESSQAPEPSLPHFLQDARGTVSRIGQLIAQVNEARRLRQQATEEVETLCRSMLSHDSEVKPTHMRELVKLRLPDVVVRPEETYQFAGVYSFGRGVFRGHQKSGMDFAYRQLTRLHAGNFVYPKLMAWEGALGIVPPECDACVVSTEFPVFEVIEEKVLPEVLDTYFRTPEIWLEISGASTGTNVRRRRLNPKDFLDYCMPLPSRTTQERLRKVRVKVGALNQLQAETSVELDALMPSILDKAFRGEL